MSTREFDLNPTDRTHSAPSVYSIKKAMQTYARQGGTSTIFVHDDGLQLISAEDREQRIAFYADHNIGWVARPPHDNTPDGFKRAGRFKKASNMNYGLRLSLKLEKHLTELQQTNGVNDEFESLEDQAMKLAVEEMYEESGQRFKPWAANGRSLRMGEIILIIDSDTIVPEDCFRDAARELVESPEVAIIQHESGRWTLFWDWPNLTLSLPQTLCRSRTTTLRTASPISLAVSTRPFRWAPPTEKLPHSSDTTPFCAGLPFRTHLLLMRPTGSGRSGQSRTYLRTSTWLSVFSSSTTSSDGRPTLKEASRKVSA